MSRRAKKNTILAMSLVIGFTIGAFLYIGGFLPFAIGNPESGEGQTSEVVVYKSPLVWRTDGEGDELLSELASGGTYELEVRVEANQTKEVELYINIPNKKAFAY